MQHYDELDEMERTDERPDLIFGIEEHALCDGRLPSDPIEEPSDNIVF